MRRILRQLSLRENKRRFLIVKGILNGRRAYKAPDVVQIDLTDRCPGGCFICWNRSPFVKKDDRVRGKEPELEFWTVSKFIAGLKSFGTRETVFSGGGEPFAYERVWEVLEQTGAQGLPFRINTSLLLPGKKDLQRLAGMKYLRSLTVSVWAAEPFLYARIHDRTPDDFRRLKESLNAVNRLKHEHLTVVLYAVINSTNFHSLPDIAEFSYRSGCDAVEFGLIDAIPGVTDHFLLSPDQLSEVKRDFLRVRERSHGMKYFSVNDRTHRIFLRRVSGSRAPEGEYDTQVIRTPCYAGWFFLRLRANGDFNSCLKSHRIPVGNVYREDISSVWNNVLQQGFRRQALRVPKDAGYFSAIGNCPGTAVGCARMCDNIMTNEHIHRVMRYVRG